MKILERYVLRGPNYWSVRKPKLIVFKLDIEEMEEFPSNKIEGFYERIKGLLPGLYEHYCSEDHAGGFLERVKKGTWMGHVVEHVALEIQTMAGMNCSFGRTRQTERTGVYNVVFSYVEERAGLYAADAAVRIVDALIEGEDYDVQADVEMLKKIYSEDAMGPSTSAIVEAAVRRDIPYIRLDKGFLVQLGYGAASKRISATVTDQTSNIAVDLASDKNDTKDLLRTASVPVPEGTLIIEEEELKIALNDIGFPLVVKPHNGNHGNGVTLNILSLEEALNAFRKAKAYSDLVIVEKYYTGKDYRFLVINGKLSAAALRIPAQVTGDGKSTIEQLVEQENKNPQRGEGHEKILTKITLDEFTPSILQEQGYQPDSIPPRGANVYLKQTANLSTGGTSEDVTEIIHPGNRIIAERVARTIGLDICGIDVVAKDISKLIDGINGAVIEVNAGPGFRMHTHPSKGKARDVGKDVVDMLFPHGQNGRIPIVAITGTNGKTTTTRLLAHITRTAGLKTGYTTTEGIYIESQMIEEGDCTGPVSSEKVLRDKSVEFAVLECARGGILRAGLAFDKCDVGIVTNVAEDHLGLKNIRSLHQMAQVKATVAESVREDGFAILNADNDYTYEMRKNVKANVALFSTNPFSNRIRNHCDQGGLAAVCDDGNITLLTGKEELFIERVENIPLTYKGKAIFMIENVLAAVLGAYVQKIPLHHIIHALHTFVPSCENTPGRMNMFHFSKFRFMIDYAHNFHGLSALGSFIRQSEAAIKVGIVSAAGDRRDIDIINVGKAAANVFDKIIIRIDEDTRGRNGSEIVDLIVKGIKEENSGIPFEVIPDEMDAIEYTILNAVPHSLTVLFTDKVKKAIEHVTKFKEMEKQLETSRIPDLLPIYEETED